MLSKNNLSGFLLLCWQFWRRNVSVQGYFRCSSLGCYRTGTFHHRDISSHGHFSTCRLPILAPYKIIFQNVYLRQSIHFVEISKPEYPNGVMLERTYKPHYHYQNFSPLANGTDLNREKYAILETHWH